MSEPYVVYRIATGEVVRSGTVGEPMDLSLQSGPGEDWILGSANDQVQYVSAGQIVDRPSLNLAVETNLARGAMLTIPVPTGTRVFVNGDELGLTVDNEPVEVQWAVATITNIWLLPPFPLQEQSIKVIVA